MEKIFKGRIIDNEGSDKWYEFSLFDIQWSDHDSIRVKVNVKINSKSSLDSFIYILKDTISQYTGIKDSEGNRIFEGDEFDCDGICAFKDGAFRYVTEKNNKSLTAGCLNLKLKLTGHNINDGGE